MRTYLVTGGAGFIGSNFVLAKRRRGEARIINLDLLTYAGNMMNLKALEQLGWNWVGVKSFLLTNGSSHNAGAVRINIA